MIQVKSKLKETVKELKEELKDLRHDIEKGYNNDSDEYDDLKELVKAYELVIDSIVIY